jgi:hypothetical protein
MNTPVSRNCHEQGILQGIAETSPLPFLGVEFTCIFRSLQRNSLGNRTGNFCAPIREQQGINRDSEADAALLSFSQQYQRLERGLPARRSRQCGLIRE